MTRHGLVFAGVALLATSQLFAQLPLPTPLTLPPDGVEVLQIDPAGSYMGDAMRVVDCPNPADEPFGTCGNELFGGVALWNSHLTGALQIRFSPPVNGVTHFEVTHPFNLTGDDVLMTMPQLYIFKMTQNTILDTFDTVSSGDLNLTTGLVTNLNYNVIFFNLWYGALGVVNPKLKPPPFQFPGVYGAAQANFSQRSDGLLDFTFYGSTFLPLGGSVSGDPVRLPMPFSGPQLELGNIQVPGMSLHPHLRITTKPSLDPPCDGVCASIPLNSVVQMTLNAAVSNIGDDYTLNIPQLGPTPAPGSVLPEGHTEVQGRVQVQFGAKNGHYVPVAFHGLPPLGLVAPTPPFPIPGLSLGLLGPDTHLVFPLQTYLVAGTVIADDPFDFSVGELDLDTGQLVGGLLWRSFWNHTLLQAVLAANAATLQPFSFQQRGPALFQKGPNGELVFRFNSTTVLPYTGFIFPAPDFFTSKAGFTGGPGSFLQPFVRLQAALPTDTPTGILSGAQTNVTSSFGEPFSYSYSVPCSGTGIIPTFTYTNTGKGTHAGTFTMTNLSSVSCTNSLTSTKPVGNYDTIQFSGYGTWSGDSNPHIATVHVSTVPTTPYVSIMIDGGQLSNADIAPAKSPAP
jgi:hypothetical protein